ncbi:helix-turn-helix transcriptional regulator [Facilibium subflavum]|uniref:helix-turn-helix transcriptional regulator n=1 Tax=Facilibium subflavum TaxID=2219058 RepID=UPI000E65450C|nr:hypothetical protein [Facilibium subflavum]
MNSLRNIYQYEWKKHEHQFTRFIRQLNLPMKVEGIVFTKFSSDNQVIEVPLGYTDHFLDYANHPDAEKSLFNNFHNALKVPPKIDRYFMDHIYSINKTLGMKTSFSSIVCQDNFLSTPVKFHYHTDNTISDILLLVKKSFYCELKCLENNGGLSDIHNKAHQFILETIQTEPFTWQNKAPEIEISSSSYYKIDKFSQLSTAENRCFSAIYHGNYETKVIAKLLHRSTRTIEGLISSMIDKLQMKNRYELFIEISNAHQHMQRLILLNTDKNRNVVSSNNKALLNQG